MNGKIIVSLLLIFGLAGILSSALFFNIDFSAEKGLPEAKADIATTSVTVLNTPPAWTVDAQESPESSIANPTNVGTINGWTATATDANNEPYYLLICATSSAPTPNPGAPPTCAGGSGWQWAVSPLTTSGSEAYATRTAQAADAEANNWWAFICDHNNEDPRCNSQSRQGSGNTASPFVVNHRPNFTAFIDDSPKGPGQTVTWYATSLDPDTYGGQDMVKLFVCLENDFTGTACGAGGTYCSSTFQTSNPSCSFNLESVKQDKDYTAYGFVVDEHYFAASGGSQGTDSVLTVSNVAPLVASSSINLLDTDEIGFLTLTVPEGSTTGFKVKFTVTDYNSCQNASAGNEIAAALINVYRSGIGMANCQADNHYNANNCYPEAYAGWGSSCSQDVGTCSGPTDPTADWTCTFPLWYHADPTTGTTSAPYYNQNWLASVWAVDDNNATSTLTEAQTGNELDLFLAYGLNTATINYGSLEAGQQNDPLDRDSIMKAIGNVGLNENLFGTAMCLISQWPVCGGGATSTIPVNEQRYASSSVPYANGIPLSGTPTLFEIKNPKTTVTNNPATSTTKWGIRIPAAITVAGEYIGENTIIGVTSSGNDW